MGGPTEPTWAARSFRIVVLVGSAALCISAFLPWCTINGLTYTFFDVDSWKWLPIAELGVAAAAFVASLVRLSRIKRIGLIVGSSGLVVNLVGASVAARFANVRNTDQYFRIWAVMSIRPNVGGWIALLTCVAMIVGALTRWSVGTTFRPSVPEPPGESPHFEGKAGKRVHVPFDSSHRTGGTQDGPSGLPRLDDVLAPPTPQPLRATDSR